MKKKLFALVLMFSLVCSFVSFANVEDAWWEGLTDITVKSELLPDNVENSYVTSRGNQRGEYIAVATANIINLGDGYIEASVSTSSHTNCDKIKMRMYVDKYNESKDTWENIKTYNYTVESADVGGELHFVAESEEIKVEKGCYYRVRGIHNVYQNGTTEGLSTVTDGVLAD